MTRLEFLVLSLFAVAVLAKFVYMVVKTIRIAVLTIDPPMYGFDSDDVSEVLTSRPQLGSDMVGEEHGLSLPEFS